MSSHVSFHFHRGSVTPTALDSSSSIVNRGTVSIHRQGHVDSVIRVSQLFQFLTQFLGCQDVISLCKINRVSRSQNNFRGVSSVVLSVVKRGLITFACFKKLCCFKQHYQPQEDPLLVIRNLQFILEDARGMLRERSDLRELVTLTPNLMCLNLEGDDYYPAYDLSNLSRLTHLRSLTLQSPAALGKIAIPGLQRLTLDFSEINDNELEHLKKLDQLEYLNISMNTQLIGGGLRYLRRLTALKELELSGCRNLTNTGVENLSHLTSLNKLNLRGCTRLSDAGFKNISYLTALENLDLSSCNVTDVGLQYLSTLTVLKKLSLWCCKRITDAGLQSLSGLTDLRKLDLTEFKITVISLKNLSNLSRLQKLTLSDCKFTDIDICLHSLSSFTCLETLRLNSCDQLTDVELSKLRCLTTLKKLNLSCCYNITGVGLQNLSVLNLEYLNLQKCKITDLDLKSLSNLSSLEKLILVDCEKITMIGLRSLNALHRLRYFI